ncbi:MAG TPA: head GIN domain-containing protein [Sphingomonas sp.]|nr:head GIN domain-containing protein [Sphingomonas sp.]
MRGPALAFLLLAAAAPGAAAERSFTIGSFDRVRVSGPFEVRLEVGGSPRARAEGDRALIDRVDIRVDGGTLVVSMGVNGWGERGAADGAPPVISLSTPTLRSAVVNGGGRLGITGMKGQALDLMVTGSGAIDARGLDARQLDAQVIGTGALHLAGSVAKVRLSSNGPAAIDAPGLAVDDLVIRTDGAGEAHVAARYTAEVTATGVGRVVVDGSPACTIRPAQGHAPVVCGTAGNTLD